MLFNQLAGEKASTKADCLFKSTVAPLQRKQPSATKANRQQAVVQPLQGQPGQNNTFHFNRLTSPNFSSNITRPTRIPESRNSVE